MKKIAYVLDTIVPTPEEGASEDEITRYVKYIDDSTLAKCYMLASMTPELQRQHESMDANSILFHLCQLFEKQGRTQRHEIYKKHFQARMTEGTSVENHVLKMIEWIEKLTGLGIVLEDNLYGYVYLMKYKSKAFEKFREYKNEGYALETAAYLLNRVPSKSVVSTPYEIWKGKKSDLKIVKIWGYPAHVRRHNLDKLKSMIE
ncbi:hypothetical protein OPV22_031121 [Ensete ventricosum]|uniref:Uncharacterized protein n=1 Tax=Ensete ventricosum TaxID=4639 RepID=A0AAV8PLK4_ENSVE|nr:hypothetical protein OPV22_031121 [Ensete ventricosum]